MVAQRGHGLAGPLAAATVPTAEKADKRPADRAAPRRKLGFNERRALETLPHRIEELRTELDALEQRLADADFAVREPAAFLDATKTYGELREALAGAEDEWLGLEILREELERQ
jgi:ATP-binding cassette subfamily F protein uup